jgi:hypothetical protein
MYVKDYREVPAELGGMDGLTVRWVINASQGATNFAIPERTFYVSSM